MNFFGLLEWACGCLTLTGDGLLWFWPCFSYAWALNCLVMSLLSFGLMSGIRFVMFLVYFKHFLYVIPTCPPINDESTKIVELFSCKPSVHMNSFFVLFGG